MLGCEFNEGDIFWYSSIYFSSKSFRPIKHIKPTQVVFVKRDPPYINYSTEYIGWFRTVKTGVTVLDIAADRDYSSIIFNTEDEAIEHWNSLVRDKIDHLQNYYEETKEKLEKRLIKKMGK